MTWPRSWGRPGASEWRSASRSRACSYETKPSTSGASSYSARNRSAVRAMDISVIICTYRRAGALMDLLGCLAAQTYGDFEVLIVDGSGDDPTVRDKVAQFAREERKQLDLRLLTS